MCPYSYYELKTWPSGQGTDLHFSEFLVVSAVCTKYFKRIPLYSIGILWHSVMSLEENPPNGYIAIEISRWPNALRTEKS